MKKPPISILFGAAAMLLTVILYFTILGNIFAQMICFVTLVGLLVAEATATFMAYLSKGEPRKVGATITICFMVPVAIVLSVVYITNFPNGYGTYLGWYFAAYVVLGVIAAILWNFSGNRESDNAALQSAKANMLNLRKLVKCVMLKPGADKFKKELNAIEEALHFSNDSVITEADARIYQMLIDLDNNIDSEDFDAAAHIAAISNEIARRTIFTKNTI